MFKILGLIALFGAIGGLVNALLTENGFILPRRETNDMISIIRPGFIVNVVIGAVAATISFGLYGPLASELLIPLIETKSPATSTQEVLRGVSLSNAVGAILVGIGGAKWLTNEVDKKLLRGAAVNASTTKGTANKVMSSSPAEAFRTSSQ